MARFFTPRFSVFFLFLTLIGLLILGSPVALAQTTITVSSNADSGPNTLREAITTANLNTALTYLITLPDNQTITLTSALPTLTFSGTIAGGSTLCPATGAGGSTLARDATAGEFRLLNIFKIGTNSLELLDISFLNGKLTGAGTFGGAIQANGYTLTIERCVFRNNQAGSAGSIYANRAADIEDCFFDDNIGDPASALSIGNTGQAVRIERTSFRQTFNAGFTNSSLLSLGVSTGVVRNCTFGGGGLFAPTQAITLSGVTSIPMSMTLEHNTFALRGNALIYANAFNADVSVTLQNNIFTTPIPTSSSTFRTNNGTGTATFTSLGGNVFASDITSNPTLLASDRDNVGLAGLGLGSLTTLTGDCVQTIPLLPGSAAIDAGVNSTLTTDTRGISRVGAPDAGAFESRGFALAITGGNNQSAAISTAFVSPLRVSVTASDASEPVNGGVVSFSAPASGAGATLSSATATVSSGTASVNATANATTGGPYNVTASAAGSTPTSVNFALTNTAPCVYSYSVTSLANTGAGTLRNVLATIGGISGCPNQFTVTFTTSGTINLTSTLAAPAKDVLVLGSTTSATAVVLRGGGSASNYPILDVPTSAQFEARYLSFTNARSVGNGGAITLGGGELQLTNCYLYNNTATNFGGAIYQGSGSFTLTNSTFASNTATSNGGAIQKASSDPALIENCTFSGNVGRAGGAIEASAGSLTINNSTFALNQAVGDPSPTGAEGGAIYGGNGANLVTINNCLIAGNTSLGTGPDLVSGFGASLGHNLIGNTAGGAAIGGTTTGNITNVSASAYLLTGLSNYGGAAPTHALLPGSVAINAGSASGAPAQDQRGISRVSTPDIGAFESRGFAVNVSSGNNQTALLGFTFANPLRVVVVGNNVSEPVNGGVVSFSAPSTHPSADLSGSSWGGVSTVMIVSNVAQVTATAAYGATGAYSVTAATRGGTSSAVFSLTNACRPVVYVTQAGAGLQNGTSWTNAYSGTALQDAIVIAAACPAGQVWVAQGIYKPTTTTDRSVGFVMVNDVAIYGGFAGISSETALSNRPAVNPLTGQPSSSTLSGDIGTPGDLTDNSYHVINNNTVVPLTSLAILDGFVITQGLDNQGSPNGKGGGMFNKGNSVVCSPTVRNCLFTDNFANYTGGAISNNGISSPTLINCVFRENFANGAGGAIENNGFGSGNNSSPMLTNVLFVGNGAIQGGAIYNNGATTGLSSPTLVNVSFVGNEATLGGAIYNNAIDIGTSSPVLTNVSFQSNTASTNGNVLYNNGGSAGSSRPTLTNCVVFGNPRSSTVFFNNNTNASVTAIYSLFDAAINPTTYTATNSLTTSISPFASTTSTELSPCAPAINTGNNAAPGLSGITTDITGANRVVATTVDMGAYEFTGTVTAQTNFTTQPVAGTSVCVGGNATAFVSVSGTGPFTYLWYKGSTVVTGQATATLTLSNLTSASAGSYSVVVTGSCNSVTSTAFSLTVNALPTATLTASPSTTLSCLQTSLTLTASGGTSYTFANASGTLGTPGTSNTLVINSPDTYSVTVANAAGCVSTTSTTVFSSSVVPSLTITAAPSFTITNGQTATLTVSGATAYTWTGGSVGASFPVSPALTTVFSVTGRDGAGCAATQSATVVVNPCGSVVHVTPTGGGLQDGSSWANAFAGTQLQVAINLAANCGAQVWVAQGMYKPTSTTGFSSRSVSFSMANGVAIYGGFAGIMSETALSNRPTVNPITGQPSGTTLSGDIGTVGNSLSDRADNSFHIVYNPASLSLNGTAILDGFVLTNGNASLGGFNGQGAGMFNEGNGSVCSPTIRNCSFLTNNAPNDGGAGMYNAANGGISSPTLTNCLFMGNSSDKAAAIANHADNNGVCSPVLTNCRFSENRANSDAIIQNFAFNNGVCSPVIQNSTFERNVPNIGGCIHNDAGTGGTSNPVIRNTVFMQNRNTSGQGIVTSEISFGGGTCHAVLTNCAFQSNSAGNGGVIANLSGADSELINCSFQGNRGTAYDSFIVSTQAAITLVNCAFWDNGPYDQPFKGPVSAEYSLFPASTTGITGPGNLTVSVSPFASTTSTELAPCSPAIDAGNPATTSATVSNTDLAGNARFFNAGRIDIGAYEFSGTGLPLSFSVLGSSTATCASSPTVTLSGSETGVTYQLQRDGTNTGGTTAGTGAVLSFGPQSLSGVYTVVATRASSSCTLVMAQLATVVSSTAVPVVSISATSGTLTCAVTSLTITATTSETALLWSNAATTHSITLNSAGVYFVTATGANGCTAVSNSLTISQDIAAPASPTLTTGPSQTLTCTNSTLTLSATALSGSSLSYVFSGPSGVLAGSGASRPVSVSGLYSVTITGANGCTSTASTTVYSNTTAPTLTVTPGSGTLTCSVTSLTLTASGTATSYSWTGGTTGTTLAISTSGTYSVTATGGAGHPANGCTSTTSVVVSQSAGVPTAGLVSSGTLSCSVTAVTLTASGGNSYAFSGPGVVASSGSSATVNVGGIYSVTVTNTATGCSSVTTTTVSSNTTASTSGLVNSGTLTCSVTVVTLTASGAGLPGGGTYAFTGTGIVASAGSSATVNQAGTFSVVVTGTNGCTALATSTVSSNTTAPTAGIVASGSLSCSNPTVTLTGSGGTAYLFSGAGIVSQSGNQAIVNLAGLFSLTVINTATGCFSTTSITVTGSLAGVAPSPTLPASASTVCEGGTVRVAATVSGTATGYQWYRNGSPVSGQTSATLMLGNVQSAQAGNYVLVVTSGCGSPTSSAFALTVNPLPTVTLLVPNNATVQGATITLPAPLTGVNFQVLGGTSFERLIIIDRINGFEIRQVDQNSNGVFPINRTGPFRLTVTDGNGCKRTVEGVVVTR